MAELSRADRQLPAYHSYVLPGWHQLLDELHARLAALDPNYQVYDVKEKYGGLRVDLGRPDNDLEDDEAWEARQDEIDRLYQRMETLVSEAEERSLTVCEYCGEPGAPNKDRGWVKTVCGGC